MSLDISLKLQETVYTTITTRTPLKIVGGNTKHFYGRATEGQVLSTARHQGILNYEPSELVVTARAGTSLQELTTTLTAQKQWLAFEPPYFGDKATLGGAIACGLSGPARPYLGAARDFVLGVTCLNGKGEILKFGGRVMKNVAGYDISRLMVGALGTLGILLDISCKVLPLPAEEVTLVIEPITLEQALAQMIHWDNQALPLTGSCFDSGKLFLRLSGISIQSARHKIPADSWSEDAHFWKQLREQNLPFFAGDNTPLWRLSVPPTTPPLTLSGETLIEWGGAQRWLRSDLPADTIRATVAAVGGHATLFRGGDRHATVFHPLSPALESLHRRIKEKFDPYNILNPHRMAMKW